MKKYAMLLMNPAFDTEKGHACFGVDGIEHHILTIRCEQDAVKKASELADAGFGAIEVCGAFGEELARKMYDAAGHRLTVGYVTYPRDQEEANARFWES